MARRKQGQVELNLDPDEEAPDDWSDVSPRIVAFDRENRRQVRDLTQDEVIEALIEKRGLIAQTAELLQCSFQGLRRRIFDDPEIFDIYTWLKEYVTDMAEEGLFDAIQAKRPWAIKMRLEKIGKDRGYSDRLELTGKDGNDLNIVVDLGLLESDEDDTAEDPSE